MLAPFVMRDIFDEVIDSSFSGYNADGMMRTDIKETESGHEIIVDIPGVKRENLTAELKDGYLVISATIGHSSSDDSGSDGRYIRRERYVGTYRRSFYVGENLKQEDIKGKFEDGVLHLFIPKLTAPAQEEERKYISIEG
jgi:HSP20 family molecular chaperone IbpA